MKRLTCSFYFLSITTLVLAVINFIFRFIEESSILNSEGFILSSVFLIAAIGGFVIYLIFIPYGLLFLIIGIRLKEKSKYRLIASYLSVLVIGYIGHKYGMFVLYD
jgi:hypothetical protein